MLRLRFNHNITLVLAFVLYYNHKKWSNRILYPGILESKGALCNIWTDRKSFAAARAMCHCAIILWTGISALPDASAPELRGGIELDRARMAAHGDRGRKIDAEAGDMVCSEWQFHGTESENACMNASRSMPRRHCRRRMPATRLHCAQQDRILRIKNRMIRDNLGLQESIDRLFEIYESWLIGYEAEQA